MEGNHNMFELNLNNTTFEVTKYDNYYEVSWYSWSEDTGSKANCHYVTSDEELVLFLAQYAK